MAHHNNNWIEERCRVIGISMSLRNKTSLFEHLKLKSMAISSYAELIEMWIYSKKKCFAGIYNRKMFARDTDSTTFDKVTLCDEIIIE